MEDNSNKYLLPTVAKQKTKVVLRSTVFVVIKSIGTVYNVLNLMPKGIFFSVTRRLEMVEL